eukprot:GHVS01035586.1.p1 GENE.GHVS01035586.1~~GHVS01035586.1.p1  ORF type:complete len:277 (-),score=38.94 GHVS01035586.1:9-839(-)
MMEACQKQVQLLDRQSDVVTVETQTAKNERSSQEKEQLDAWYKQLETLGKLYLAVGKVTYKGQIKLDTTNTKLKESDKALTETKASEAELKTKLKESDDTLTKAKASEAKLKTKLNQSDKALRETKASEAKLLKELATAGAAQGELVAKNKSLSDLLSEATQQLELQATETRNKALMEKNATKPYQAMTSNTNADRPCSQPKMGSQWPQKFQKKVEKLNECKDTIKTLDGKNSALTKTLEDLEAKVAAYETDSAKLKTSIEELNKANAKLAATVVG